MSSLSGNLDCPTCGQIDHVRKVTAIIAGDTGFQSYSGRSRSGGVILGKGGIAPVLAGSRSKMSGTSTTALTQQLLAMQPPAELLGPPTRVAVTAETFKRDVVLIGGPILLAVLCFLVVPRTVAAAWAPWIRPLLEPHFAQDQRVTMRFWASLILWVLVSWLCIRLWRRLPAIRSMRETQPVEKARLKAEIEGSMAAHARSGQEEWERQWDAWERSYYCGRCGNVFQVDVIN